MFFRRKELAWEVVDSRAIDPVPSFYDEDSEDLDVAFISEADSTRTYVFELSNMSQKSQTMCENAVSFARKQLLEEVGRRGYNIFLTESWKLIVHRRGKLHRIEVQYTGRAAQALGKVPTAQSPPFLALLQNR